ncbi:MAG: hypothetical protein WA989_01185, partial [Henriciella sp.]|uniref:hypothetical protein n=1 Tax=Henriciella sp. TaxID=1968823 RepID=UPI003C75C29A
HADWAFNLAEWAPHISDANVAAAWAEVLREDTSPEAAERKAVDRIVQARRTGAPTFRISQALATELLRAVLGQTRSAGLRSQCIKELQRWNRRARRMLFDVPYMAWEKSGEDLQSGAFDARWYTTIVKGQLSDSGFSGEWSDRVQ